MKSPASSPPDRCAESPRRGTRRPRRRKSPVTAPARRHRSSSVRPQRPCTRRTGSWYRAASASRAPIARPGSARRLLLGGTLFSTVRKPPEAIVAACEVRWAVAHGRFRVTARRAVDRTGAVVESAQSTLLASRRTPRRREPGADVGTALLAGPAAVAILDRVRPFAQPAGGARGCIGRPAGLGQNAQAVVAVSAVEAAERHPARLSAERAAALLRPETVLAAKEARFTEAMGGGDSTHAAEGDRRLQAPLSELFVAARASAGADDRRNREGATQAGRLHT
jgi:hypothetical protein